MDSSNPHTAQLSFVIAREIVCEFVRSHAPPSWFFLTVEMARPSKERKWVSLICLPSGEKILLIPHEITYVFYHPKGKHEPTTKECIWSFLHGIAPVRPTFFYPNVDVIDMILFAVSRYLWTYGKKMSSDSCMERFTLMPRSFLIMIVNFELFTPSKLWYDDTLVFLYLEVLLQ